MTMRVAIEADRCNGHGRCYDLAPDLVDADDDGRGVVIRADVPRELEDQARRAEGGCPERAVTVEISAEAASAQGRG